MTTKNIALLDGQTIQALPVAKSLKNQGFKIISLCDSKESYGYHTKYADKKIIVPSTKTELPDFHSSLIKIIKDEKIDVLIPLNDYSAGYLSKNKMELLKHANFFIPDYDVFISGYNKNQLMRICGENNYPHPKTVDLSVASVKEAAEVISFPALIKPNETTGARGFAVVYTVDELKNQFHSIKKKYGDCHLQEFIPSGGRQFKVELFIYKKELINSTVINKIRYYPVKGGSSCFVQTIDHEELVNLCFQVLNEIGWEGFADFDLIEDPRDGVIKIMEINPRIPACIKAAFSAGVDFAENIVSASIGISPKKYKYNPGAYLRYLGLDFLWLVKSKNCFASSSLWFKTFWKSNLFLQDGSLDDIKPFVHGTLGGLIKQMNPSFKAEKGNMN